MQATRSRILTALLLVAYLGGGIYAAWFSYGLTKLGIRPTLSFGNALIHTVLIIPLLVAVAGWVALIKGRSADLFLWLSALAWLAITAPELAEPGPIMPNAYAIVTIFVVSVSSIVLLLIRTFPRRKNIVSPGS